MARWTAPSAATEAALKAYQEFAGFEPDGIAGPITKGQMVNTRNDMHKDVVKDGDVANFAAGAEIKYFITNSPGYLPDAAVAAEIAAACQAWADTGAVGFAAAADEASAELLISWEDKTDDAGERVFDGPGGCIAHAGKGDDGKAFLQFDAAERWGLATGGTAAAARKDKKYPHVFRVLPVAIHELGHALGLTHSKNPLSAMAPYYVANRVRLHEEDTARIKALL